MAALYIIPDYIALSNWIASLTNFGFNLIQGVLGASLGIAVYVILIKAKVRPPANS
jgi:hypothetical protein